MTDICEMAIKITQDKKNRAEEMYKTGKYTFCQISREIGCSDEPIRKYLLSLGYKAKTYSEAQRKYNLDKNFFDTIDNEEKAYFLGFLYADGFICDKRNSLMLQLKEDDKEILERLKDSIGYSGPLKYRVRNLKWKGCKKGSKNSWCLNITDKHLISQLINKGCTPRKTFTAQFPSIPSELSRHFIRGYFDGDGCVRSSIKKGGNVSFTFDVAGNESFLKEYQKIMINELGLNSTKISEHGGIFYLRYGGNNNCRKIKHFLYDSSNIFLKRKFEKFKSLI